MIPRTPDEHGTASPALDGLHLFVLASLAVAQPLLDVLSRAPEFFLAQRLSRADILLATAVACALVPSSLVLAEVLVGIVSRRARWLLHLGLVAVLGAMLALLVLQRVSESPGSYLVAAAGVLGAILAYAYGRFVPVRSFVTLLSPAILVVPALFLLASPVSTLLFSGARSAFVGDATPRPYSIVMVVFDEFPVSSLLDEDYEIDSARFPNFAALARDATWFSNTTTVADVTQAAVPALLTGRYPDLAPLADPEVHEANLFTLLAGTHDLDVRESYVPFCPPDLCPPEEGVRTRPTTMVRDLAVILLHVLSPPDLRRDLPDVSVPMLLLRPGQPAAGIDARLRAAQQSHFRGDPDYRARLFQDLIDRIGPHKRPVLHYLHVLLPHEPSLHLPSGRMCTPELTREPILWGADRGVADRAYQRHLLQLEFVDQLVGRLVARLKETGRYDSTILVLTGDHGVSYRTRNPRRAISKENLCDIIAVPLIIKAPGQSAGGVDDANVESVDVLPTILDYLGVPSPWPMDGRSLAREASEERPAKTLIGPYWGDLEKDFFPDGTRASIAPRLERECLGVERKVKRFGSGADRRRLFASGPYASLVGAVAREIPSAPPVDLEVTIDDLAALEGADPGAPFVPCTVRGRVAGRPLRDGDVDLAIAINGVVRAVSRIARADAGKGRLVATVAEASFAAGGNRVTAFAIAGGVDEPTLAPVRTTAGKREPRRGER